MEKTLYSKKVITRPEREIIEAKNTNTDKMDYLIDILIVSLNHSLPDKYRGFLIALETSEDILLHKIAKDLGKIILSYSYSQVIINCLQLHVYTYHCKLKMLL